MNSSGRRQPVCRCLASRFFLLLVSSSAALLCQAQSPAELLPLFADDAVIEMTLEAPLRTLSRNTRARKWHDAVAHVTEPSGETVTLDLSVRVRGNSRLQECNFPPLRLNFKRRQLAGTIFAGQNRLKLVTLCRQFDRHRDYLALEHDIYRLFNELTDRSFRVRRVNVNYVDTASRNDASFTEAAFLIEEDWEVAARHGVDVIERERLGLADLDSRHTALISLFHFVIGNTDWSALRGPDEDICCHNGKVIGTEGEPVFVIPYDFDQSGLIDTDYSSPSDILPIRRVTQRFYRGFCEFNSEIDTAVAHMMDRRSALEAVLQNSAASADAAEKALEYLRESLAILDDDEELDRQIRQRCRG